MTPKELVESHIAGRISSHDLWLSTPVAERIFDAYRDAVRTAQDETKAAEDVQAKLGELIRKIEDHPDEYMFGDFADEITAALNGKL